jgi:uncharacterized protein YdiU (UPF0061 family)
MGNDAAVRAFFKDAARVDAWLVRWRERLGREDVDAGERAARIRAVNPIYIPRNHLVEDVINAAVQRRDFKPFEDLLSAIAKPFEERAGLERYAEPALPEERVLQTFCGT